MIAPLHHEFLLIRNRPSFLIVAKANERFSLYIETVAEECCQTVEPADLIVVSAPEGGEVDAGVMLISLVRRHHAPLIVLPAGHPASHRLRYVVSAGQVVETNCSIIRGTHPEQRLICSSAALSGMTLRGVDGGVEITNLPSRAELVHFQSRINIDFFENKP